MPPRGQAASSIVFYQEHLGKKIGLWHCEAFHHFAMSEKQKRTLPSTGHSSVLGRKDLQVSDLNRILVHAVNQLTNISLKSIRTTG